MSRGANPIPNQRIAPLSGNVRITPDGESVDIGTAKFNLPWYLWMNDLDARIKAGGSGAPTGPAGGDLDGTYPDPSVVALQGNPVQNAAPSTSDVLTWSGTEWEPQALPATPGAITIDFHTLSAPTTNIVASVLPAPAGGFLAVVLLTDSTPGRLVTWDAASFLISPAGGLGLSTLPNTYSVLLFIAISAKWLGGVLFTGRL